MVYVALLHGNFVGTRASVIRYLYEYMYALQIMAKEMQ